ncbi:MAG: thiopeptide-type bacteriocin biosynthesis protein [Pseudonocardiales bacterium]|nr:thiopeptide-type bacteriocin biosynthesis protein [Pseudonocardiales bacterium]
MPEQPATAGIPVADWLYYRIYPAAGVHIDSLLVRVLRPVLERLRTDVPGLRWFFLRFIDAGGVHVRLRLHAPLPALEQTEHLLDGALVAARQPVRGRRPLCDSFGTHLYAPETEKFGAGVGIRLAEDLFHASSWMVLGLLTDDGCTPRVAYAAAHLLDLLGTLPMEQQAGFLYHYAWYWAGGPTGRTTGFATADAAAYERAARVLVRARQVLASPSSGKVLRRYCVQYRAEMEGPGRHRVPRTDYLLLFHHLHLTHNRLGVSVATEAALARALWLSLDAERPRHGEVDKCHPRSV